MNEVSLWYHPVLEALGYAIFHSLWQSVLLFFPLQLLLLFVKGAGQRYRLLFGAFSVIFLVFVITFCMELNEAIALRQQYTALTQNVGKDSLAATANQFIGIAPKHWWQQLTGFYHDPHFKQILPVVSICYVMGILVLGLRLMLSFRNIKAIRRDVQLAPMPLQEKFSSLVKLIAIKRKVSLYFSEKINVPMMMGHLKPIVILPLALINQLDWQQTEAVLIHELAHVKRMDYLLNILQSVMEMLMFFNPMVWWLSAIIRKEREHCCDDVAIQHTNQPVKYAEALLHLELSKSRLQPAMAATGNNKKYSLLNRIKRIVEMKTNSKRSPQSILAALTALMFIAAFCCYYSAVAQEKTSNPPKPATQEPKYVAPQPPPAPTVMNDNEIPEAPESPEVPEAPEAPEIDATTRDAMDAAHTALKQIKWDEVNDAMKQAGKELSKVDFKEMNDDIRQSMKEAQKEIAAAQKELNGQDMAAVGNSLAIASDALKAIDWNEIGDNINSSLASIKYLDTKEMKDAMKEVKVAMKQARAETLKASNDLKAQRDSVKLVRVIKMDQLSDEHRASLNRAMAAKNEALANAQRARNDAFRQAQQAREQVFEAKQAARSGNESTSKNERLLKQLQEDGFINRNERFAISYKNNTLMVNGTQVDTKRYQSNLPQSSNARLSITGNKNKLAISLKE